MDILYTTDNRYLDITLSSIYSFLCNGNIEKLRFHIITSNFSKYDYQKIELFFKLYPNIEYYFYPLETFDIEKYNIPNWRGSQIANARLFFQDILKESIDQIDNLLYLDSDTIIVDDLNGLSDYTNGLFAVKDVGRLKREYQKLGNLINYYNSGVLFINMKEWFNNDYQRKIIHTIENHPMNFTFPDQDLLNCALSEHIKTLPIRYNVSPHTYVLNSIYSKLYFNDKIKCVNYGEVQEEKHNPKIIHSYGFLNIKPWDSTMNPFQDEYMKYILSVNPEFKPNELKQLKKLITKIPVLYYTLTLAKAYLPYSAGQKLNDAFIYIQKKMH